jgi:beta-glucanase (GH16 family)
MHQLFHPFAGGVRATSGRRPGRTAILTAVTGLVVGLLAAGSPAQAADAHVTVKTIGHKHVASGARAVVAPRYSARKGVTVRSATVTVRRGATWVTRGAKSARLAPGTYRVTSKVTYRVRANGSQGRLRTKSRTQTLRVKASPVAPVAAPSAVPAPSIPVPSLATTSSACDDTGLRKPDGSAWLCTFSDEFSGDTLDRDVWTPQRTATSSYHIGDDCFVDDPANVAVRDGVLALSVTKEAAPFTCASPEGDYTSQHTAGMVSTWDSFAQARGRFEIRAAFPATEVAGHHGALWLFPKNPTAAFPYSGEIDIAEMYSAYPDRAIPFVHYEHSYGDPTVTNNHCMIDDVSDFHTYTLEWTPTTLSIAYDGRVCVTHQINRSAAEGTTPPFDGEFILALTQGRGLFPNAPTAETPDTGTTTIDYVRVWQ